MALLPATPVDGMLAHRWVAAIADLNAPKLTEINAVGSLDISCYLSAWEAGGEQASVSDVRLCGTEDYEQPGKVTRSLSLTYIENPGSATDNKAFETLVPQGLGFIVQRRGVVWDDAFAVGDTVDVWPVRHGLQLPVSEAGQVLRITQKQFVIGPVAKSVLVVA